MAPTSVRKTQQQFQAVAQRMETKLQQMMQRREEMDARAFVVVDEGGKSVQNSAAEAAAVATGLDEQPELYRGEVGSLVSTATDVIIRALQIKVTYVHNILERLSLLVNENPRQATPPELSFSRYEEWLESNQQLFEINSQLYDLERVKFDLKQRQQRVKNTLPIPGRRYVGTSTDVYDTESQLVHSSINHVQGLLARIHRCTHSNNTTRVYIHELLNPRGGKTTLEARKVREYISECLQNADADPSEIKGVHSDRYQEFMAILCAYIVEKQKEKQREDVSYELVYSAVEHCIIPQLKSLMLPRVAQRDQDANVCQQCQAHSSVTLDQLRVRPRLQSKEAVPFIEAITQLRASYFSSTPTDKMYSIVAAAKALYDQLGDLGETSIDGDSFLDLWIYVIIKANVKDLVTNLRFMIEYGNPQLANGEAGYYLTTLEAAVQFIATLTPQTLKAPVGRLEFVVCERAHFISLCSLPGTGLELVAREVELQGYRVAVLQDWALDRARLFRSALVPTANYSDTAKVAIVRVNHENTNPAIVQYLLKQFAVSTGVEGLFSKTIPLGAGVFVNMSSIDRQNLILLPTGDYDQHSSDITHVLQLLRLGSLTTNHTMGSEESCLLPSSTARSRTLDIPVSPPYFTSNRSTAGDTHRTRTKSVGETSDRKQAATSRSLWSPYVLNSPQQIRKSDEKEAYFTDLAAGGSSLKSEHRRLVQARCSPESLDRQSGNSRLERSQSIPTFSLTSGESNSATQSKTRTSPPATVTVQVELHEASTSRNIGPGHPPAREGNIYHDEERYLEAEEDKDESTLNLIAGSDRQRKTQGEQGAAVANAENDIVIENFATEDGKVQRAENEVDGIEGGGGEEGLKSQEDALSGDELEKNHCFIRTDLVTPENVLSSQYRAQLEDAFVSNHLYGNCPQSIAEAARSIILQAQLYLQRLNYLSVSYKIAGDYDNITLAAITTFQTAHNRHEAEFSMSLPENGHLTPPTYQFLRQAFLTIYASMLRLGLDKHLGETFDPMSYSPRDVAMFRECMSEFQSEHGLLECQSGAMCANTIEKVKHLLRTQRQTFS